jgi:transposase-like protein
MSEHSIDLVLNLIRGRKSNGRSMYHAAAKRELVRRCLQPGVSLAATAVAHGLNPNLLRKWVVLQTEAVPGSQSCWRSQHWRPPPRKRSLRAPRPQPRVNGSWSS